MSSVWWWALTELRISCFTNLVELVTRDMGRFLEFEFLARCLCEMARSVMSCPRQSSRGSKVLCFNVKLDTNWNWGRAPRNGEPLGESFNNTIESGDFHISFHYCPSLHSLFNQKPYFWFISAETECKNLVSDSGWQAIIPTPYHVGDKFWWTPIPDAGLCKSWSTREAWSQKLTCCNEIARVGLSSLAAMRLLGLG